VAPPVIVFTNPRSIQRGINMSFVRLRRAPALSRNKAPRATKGGTAVISVALAALVALSGCASSGNPGSNTADSSSGELAMSQADSQKILTTAFAGEKYPLPSDSPKPMTGKKVWILNCLAYATCRAQTAGLLEVGKTFDWDIREMDSKSDPRTSSTLIMNAIADKADAVVVLGMDCASIATALSAAKQANVVTLSLGGQQCSDPTNGYTAQLKLNGADGVIEQYKLYGESDGKVLAAATVRAGINSPTILDIATTDQEVHNSRDAGFKDAIGKHCASCKVETADFTLAQLAGSQGAQLIRTAVLDHPDAQVIYFPFDPALVSMGIKQALSSAPNVKLVFGGDGGGGALDLIGTLKQELIVNTYDLDFIGWGAFDALNRIFSGVQATSLPNEGGWITYADADHKSPKPPFDYNSEFKKLWGLQ
jgi:ribose transport system substrate-binding protein